jgi:hypothetical protein
MEPVIVNGVQVKSGQIWQTKSGNRVLIVNLLDRDRDRDTKPSLGFIWFDEVDKDLNVSELLNRLDTFISAGVSERWTELIDLVQSASLKS